MTFTEFELWQERNARISSLADDAEHKLICDSLPEFALDSPRGCGAHSYPSMRLFLREVHPKSLLEVGFNLGHSSLFWLRNGVEIVTSIEIRYDADVKAAETYLKEYALDRGDAFRLVTGDSIHSFPILTKGQFDAAFIDGSHEYEAVMGDIAGCLSLEIPRLFFDDWLTIYGGVQQAIHDSKLHVLWVSGNQALCTK